MEKKIYKLTGSDGKIFYSSQNGKYGGNKNAKCYGLMDCPSALKWIEEGYYVKNRVFFANDFDALMAGYHPCNICQHEKHIEWRKDPNAFLEKYKLLDQIKADKKENEDCVM